jgi:hypothetical protein
MPEEALTSAQSPDTLPLRGYTVDQLCAYIFRQLGSPQWIVELTKQQAVDAIQDALALYGQWRPYVRVQAITLIRSQSRYLEDVDCGQGVAVVNFVEPLPSPTAIFYGNLIDPAPMFKTGLDDYDTFLRWRKTWARVTSVQPDWYWDDFEKVLFIHNPIERYHAAAFCYFSFTDTVSLDPFGADWVKQYALEKARWTYASILMKYSGAIPAPVAQLTLSDGRPSAEAKMKELETKLFGAQRLDSQLQVD